MNYFLPTIPLVLITFLGSCKEDRFFPKEGTYQGTLIVLQQNDVVQTPIIAVLKKTRKGASLTFDKNNSNPFRINGWL